jgi:hypothetical protein
MPHPASGRTGERLGAADITEANVVNPTHGPLRALFSAFQR